MIVFVLAVAHCLFGALRVIRTLVAYGLHVHSVKADRVFKRRSAVFLKYTNLYMTFVIRENDDVPVRPHTPLEQYACPRNSDSYFVNIRYDRTAILFVDFNHSQEKTGF